MTTSKKKAENFYTHAVSPHLTSTTFFKSSKSDHRSRMSRIVIGIERCPRSKVVGLRILSKGRRCVGSSLGHRVFLFLFSFVYILCTRASFTTHSSVTFMHVLYAVCFDVAGRGSLEQADVRSCSPSQVCRGESTTRFHRPLKQGIPRPALKRGTTPPSCCLSI